MAPAAPISFLLFDSLEGMNEWLDAPTYYSDDKHTPLVVNVINIETGTTNCINKRFKLWYSYYELKTKEINQNQQTKK